VEVARLLIELLKALAWPAVTLATVMLLRRSIAETLPMIARRITRVSWAGLRLDLIKVPEVQVPAQLAEIVSPGFSPRLRLEAVKVAPIDISLLEPKPLDLSKPIDVIGEPTIVEWLDRLRANETPSYLPVHLGPASDPQWLITRLYILTILLQVRGVPCLVFTEGRRGGSERFIGIASADDLRWALAQQYPWLELAYARAYSKMAPESASDVSRSLSTTGVLGVNVGELLFGYIGEVQRPVRPEKDPGWVQLPGGWEQGDWVTSKQLEIMLGDRLSTSQVKITASDETLAQQLIALRGRFVAVVDRKSLFSYLVDRMAVLEFAAGQSSPPEEPNQPRPRRPQRTTTRTRAAAAR
jgi:hypothetical protein